MFVLVLLLAVLLIGYVVYSTTPQVPAPPRRRMRTTYPDGGTAYTAPDRSTALASTDAYTPAPAYTYGTTTDEIPPSHIHHHHQDHHHHHDHHHHPDHQHGHSSGGGASGDWSDDPHGQNPIISSDTTHHASHDFGGTVDTGPHHTSHENPSVDYGSGSDTGSSYDYGTSSDSSSSFDSGHHHHD